MMRLLEKSLRDEKNSSTTISALLENVLARHADLRDILAGVGEYSTKFVLQRFKHRFKSLFRISKSSMSVVAILVMNMISCHSDLSKLPPRLHVVHMYVWANAKPAPQKPSGACGGQHHTPTICPV